MNNERITIPNVGEFSVKELKEFLSSLKGMAEHYYGMMDAFNQRFHNYCFGDVQHFIGDSRLAFNLNKEFNKERERRSSEILSHVAKFFKIP